MTRPTAAPNHFPYAGHCKLQSSPKYDAMRRANYSPQRVMAGWWPKDEREAAE